MHEPGLHLTRRSPPLEEGCRIAGRYRLGGRVEARTDLHQYEAWDEENARWVLLVVEHTPSVRDARLVHHGIAQREDVGCIGEWFVSVIDPGPGEGLPRLLGRLGAGTPLDLESTMIVGLGLCEALTHVGRWGLYHGDLSARALHVSPQLDPVLLDFPSNPGGRLSPAAIPFASPERLLGHAGDTRSDVYAIAALLYTLRVGHPPFGWNEHQAREGHFYDAVIAHPRIPEPVMEVLLTALEKPPRLRYPDPHALATALTEAYERAAGWSEDEPLPGFGGDETEEVPLEEAETVRARAIPVLSPDPGTTWESFTRDEPLELLPTADDLSLPAALAADPLSEIELELDDSDDRTLELGPDMLDLLADQPELPRAELPRAELPPTTGRRFPGDRLARPAYIPAAAPPPAPRSVPYFTSPAPIAASRQPVRRRMEPDSLEMEMDPAAPDDVYLGQHPDEWVDTLPPARPRETTVIEEESLPLMVLAAVCALAVGMASAASVLAFLLAQITL
ncbi:MAG: hypothetical protein H6737_04295 [Alphaproteobacteria bacterium]|nr:hypothetical protein [Alphaproteobacteria bacterium]